MAATFRDMIAGYPQPGHVEWIGVRPERRVTMQSIEAVMISANGLDGDRSRAGKRAVTLIQQEHLGAIESYLGRGPVAPETLRRNLVVSGINLAALKGAGGAGGGGHSALYRDLCAVQSDGGGSG